MVQSILYRHVRVDSLQSLVLLVRSLNETKDVGRSQIRRLDLKVPTNQILTLDIIFDKLRRGLSSTNEKPVAVLVSGLLHAISR